MDCKHDSGKKRKMRVVQNVDSVEKLVLSQGKTRALTKRFVTFKRHIFKTSVHIINAVAL